MDAAVELREPLVPLYPQNSKDVGRKSTALGKLSQRQKVIRKSASLGGASGAAISAAKAETIAENLVSRASPEPIAEEPKSAMEISQVPQNRSTEEQGEVGITRDEDRHDYGAADEQESKSLMQLQMEAMTWAAMAKDYTISSLERRLRQALEIAKAEQERNEELGRLLRESKQRNAAAALEMKDAKGQIEQLIEAEERLCVQLGDLEAEAVEEYRSYRSQIATLSARIEAQDQFIAGALKPLKLGQSPSGSLSQSQESNSLSYAQKIQDRSLSAKLEMAQMEIAALQVDLRDAKHEFEVTEGLRKRQSRKLKVLEKERCYLMRKGAIRSIRLATPRSHMKSETPGGEGWKVFSVLDFQA